MKKNKILLWTVSAVLTVLTLSAGISAQTGNEARSIERLRNYSSIQDAVSRIGGNTVELVVEQDAQITGDVTIPRNIRLKFEGDSQLTVPRGRKVIVSSMEYTGNKKIFAGDGEILIAKGAVPELNLTWWAGTDDSVDATHAFNQMIESLYANSGGKAIIPPGNWKTTGGHKTFPVGTTVEGVGSYSNGKFATNIQLIRDNTYIFKIGDLMNSITIKNLSLEGDGRRGATGILAEGIYPNTAANITIENVAFNDFQTGFKVNALPHPLSPWQLEALNFINCRFIGNEKAFSSNTNNSSYTFINPFFQMPDRGFGLYLEKAGQTTVISHNAQGSSGSPPCVNGKPDPRLPTFIYVGGDHLPLTVIGGQDEAVGYFLINDASVGTPINLFGNSIQSMIQFKHPAFLNSQGNYYMREIIRDVPGIVARVWSQGDYLQARNICAEFDRPTQLSKFEGESLIVTESDFENFTETRRTYFDVILPPVYMGGPNRPIAQLGTTVVSKPFLRMGLTDPQGNFTYYYDFSRNTTSGLLDITGSQEGYRGINLAGKMIADDIEAKNGLAVGSGGTVTKGIRHGTARLSGGTARVNDPAVTPNSRIFLTAQDDGTTGSLRISNRTQGSGFTIRSSNASDSGNVAWQLIEP